MCQTGFDPPFGNNVGATLSESSNTATFRINVGATLPNTGELPDALSSALNRA
ncbi:MAG: hypothetical protein HZB20_04060 [Chloroflexi bacterium]|nr:hypothetical protein [Chloroflexota bacterium]